MENSAENKYLYSAIKAFSDDSAQLLASIGTKNADDTIEEHPHQQTKNQTGANPTNAKSSPNKLNHN